MIQAHALLVCIMGNIGMVVAGVLVDLTGVRSSTLSRKHPVPSHFT
jgi:hypothetical protein